MAGKTVLVTGGAGYIGSHTVVELLNAGYECVSVDNYVNSCYEAYNRIREITGKNFAYYDVDLAENKAGLEKVFAEHKIDIVIHFAGLKAVGESTKQPLRYHKNNLFSTLNLLDVMEKYNCRNLVFSSSATVYGEPDKVPITESAPLKRPTNPYGRTKFFTEEILRDLYQANPKWNFVILRYFNPVVVAQVAVGRLPKVNVFGNDYPTPDGTGVRDYIHVVDLALGHVAALKKLQSREGGVTVYNLGTGRGYSVLEMIAAMSKACGKQIPYEVTSRRPGDVAIILADPSTAEKELGWKATRGIDDMCADLWRWQTSNPYGYRRPAL